MGHRKQGWSAAGISAPTPLHPFYAPSSGPGKATSSSSSSPSLPSLPSPSGAPASPSPSTTALKAPIAEETDYVASVLERALGEVQ